MWLKEKSLWSLSGIVGQCQKLMRNKTLQSEVARRISLFEMEQAIPEYKANMTQGKYLVYPQEKPKTNAAQAVDAAVAAA